MQKESSSSSGSSSGSSSSSSDEDGDVENTPNPNHQNKFKAIIAPEEEKQGTRVGSSTEENDSSDSEEDIVASTIIASENGNKSGFKMVDQSAEDRQNPYNNSLDGFPESSR